MNMGKDRPALKFVFGQWYAYGRNTRAGRQLLVAAINWCKLMNGVAS